MNDDGHSCRHDFWRAIIRFDAYLLKTVPERDKVVDAVDFEGFSALWGMSCEWKWILLRGRGIEL